MYIQEVFYLSYLLFDFSPVKRQERTNSLVRELFTPSHRGRERGTLAPSKREARSAKSEVSKVSFPDIGKNTNLNQTHDIRSDLKTFTFNFSCVERLHSQNCIYSVFCFNHPHSTLNAEQLQNVVRKNLIPHLF